MSGCFGQFRVSLARARTSCWRVMSRYFYWHTERVEGERVEPMARTTRHLTDGETATPSRKRAAGHDELIAKYIEPHPGKPGWDEWRLKERSVPVWAIIGALILPNNPALPRNADYASLGYPALQAALDLGAAQAFPNDALIARVAQEYGVSRSAVEAAIAYYRKHKGLLDARLIANIAA